MMHSTFTSDYEMGDTFVMGPIRKGVIKGRGDEGYCNGVGYTYGRHIVEVVKRRDYIDHIVATLKTLPDNPVKIHLDFVVRKHKTKDDERYSVDKLLVNGEELCGHHDLQVLGTYCNCECDPNRCGPRLYAQIGDEALTFDLI